MINSDRGTSLGTKADYFDRNFEYMDFKWGYEHADILPSKPEKFDEMIVLAEKIAYGIPQLRVDFYLVNNRIYFGETTFFDGSGFDRIEPYDWDIRLGKYINL